MSEPNEGSQNNSDFERATLKSSGKRKSSAEKEDAAVSESTSYEETEGNEQPKSEVNETPKQSKPEEPQKSENDAPKSVEQKSKFVRTKSTDFTWEDIVKRKQAKQQNSVYYPIVDSPLEKTQEKSDGGGTTKKKEEKSSPSQETSGGAADKKEEKSATSQEASGGAAKKKPEKSATSQDGKPPSNAPVRRKKVRTTPSGTRIQAKTKPKTTTTKPSTGLPPSSCQPSTSRAPPSDNSIRKTDKFQKLHDSLRRKSGSSLRAKRNVSPDAKKEKEGGSIREKLKKGFANVSKALSVSKVGLEKSYKRAQSKMQNLRKMRLTDDDDAFPINEQRPFAETAINCVWSEDVPWIKDRTHRSDLELVKNNENDGELFLHGNPFWRDSDVVKSTPLPKFRKAVTAPMLFKVAEKKLELTEKLPDPPFDSYAELNEMKDKDPKWFTDNDIATNTIRSIVQALDVDDLFKPTPSEIHLLKITEPNSMITYPKNFPPEVAVRKSIQSVFKKSSKGVLGRKDKVDFDTSSENSSTSSGSSGSRSPSSSSGSDSAVTLSGRKKKKDPTNSSRRVRKRKPPPAGM